ncbi:hypothetical protein PMAYCL1PPCAC_27177 [Pristionchus mayeri]|uniref:BTB domain-containing protein n=1 Tax=Pristionchus mayeri TaxID=1317129 RepID=A0AAN5I8W6_9BILA|nr:hypothetical protein PMAYCL1PPCAC_27177 [Pristionchus mayeri]
MTKKTLPSRWRLASGGDGEVARLREQVRLLNSEMTTLRREKERLEGDKLCYSEHIIQFSITVSKLAEFPYASDPFELKNVTVTLHGAVIPDCEAVAQLVFWCEMLSSSVFDTTLITKCAINNSSTYTTGPFMQIVRLREGSQIPSGRHFAGPWNTIKSTFSEPAVKFSIKLVRPCKPSSIKFDAGDNYVTMILEDESIQVNAPYVSEWSDFLRSYFISPMKETNAGIYPIEDCPVDDFREMLDVIYPTGKPIDVWNVERMLVLADRFIMPMLTRQCELFLNDGHKHTMNEIQMLLLADKYNLFLTRTNILEKLTTTALLRSKIIKTEGYATLSHEMKRAVDARYVELDVQERG